MNENKPTLVLGGTGKTGRRVVERLTARGLPTRVATPSSDARFDWEDPSTWAPALDGAGSVYLTYYPDLAVPGAVEATGKFARAGGAQRGHPAGAPVRVEASPRPSGPSGPCATRGAELTILRSTWFMQNFSEDYMLEHVLGGEIRLPAGEVPTPFLDADDIADVAVAALTDDRHVGQLYELTGPRSLTFSEVAAEIGAAAGRRGDVHAGHARRACGRRRRARRAARGDRPAQLPVQRGGGRTQRRYHRRRPARARPAGSGLRRLRAGDRRSRGLVTVGCDRLIAAVACSRCDAAGARA